MHGLERLPLLADLKVLHESPAELLGENHTTEGGLAIALGRDEQGNNGVAILLSRQNPLGDHRQEPFAEPLLPLGDIAGYATGQHGDMVCLTVPLA